MWISWRTVGISTWGSTGWSLLWEPPLGTFSQCRCNTPLYMTSCCPCAQRLCKAWCCRMGTDQEINDSSSRLMICWRSGSLICRSHSSLGDQVCSQLSWSTEQCVFGVYSVGSLVAGSSVSPHWWQGLRERAFAFVYFCPDQCFTLNSNSDRDSSHLATCMSLWFMEALQPFEGIMISSSCEAPAIQIGAELLHSPNQAQHFLESDAIFSLRHGQCLAGIAYHSLHIIPLLREDCS